VPNQNQVSCAKQRKKSVAEEQTHAQEEPVGAQGPEMAVHARARRLSNEWNKRNGRDAAMASERDMRRAPRPKSRRPPGVASARQAQRPVRPRHKPPSQETAMAGTKAATPATRKGTVYGGNGRHELHRIWVHSKSDEGIRGEAGIATRNQAQPNAPGGASLRLYGGPPRPEGRPPTGNGTRSKRSANRKPSSTFRGARLCIRPTRKSTVNAAPWRSMREECQRAQQKACSQRCCTASQEE